MNNEQLLNMMQRAKCVLAHSYSPFSRFSVGVCLRTESGELFDGCNVENSSYGQTICAEGSAITTMVSQGERKITDVVIIAATVKVCPPCGACRQLIAEFGSDDTQIYLCDTDFTVHKTLTLAELLPERFVLDV